ncbi:MAG: exosortase system-associated protein, TIGR04073 family [Candidatus Omnitrophica bacterium]|nr:exosortase system-associated protein, TIGR04073 family [Candidatus Omnitrophota bacterium]
MKKILVFFCVAMVMMSASAIAADPPDAAKAAAKFARGVTNVATCWGEYIIQLPVSIEQSPDYLTGAVYDVVRGTGFTIRRAAVGLYDIVTCPFPGRTCYGPLIQPETIFTKSVEPLIK